MNNSLYLMPASKQNQKEIWEYRQEFFDFGESNVNGSCGMAKFQDFDEWLEMVLAVEKERLSKDGIHASTFFSVRKADGKIIGSIQLRHALTPDLAEHGGHIGYGIRPTERKKGYGTQQLQLVLDIARQMGILRVMITCLTENTASAHTAVRCGGVLTRENVYEGQPQQIYWIDLE